MMTDAHQVLAGAIASRDSAADGLDAAIAAVSRAPGERCLGTAEVTRLAGEESPSA